MSDKTETPKKKLLTTFDIILIAAVVVIAALFLVWKASSGGAGPISTAKTDTVRFTVELANLPETALAQIKEGDELIETVKNTSVGRVVSCDVINTAVWHDNLETGGMTMSETEMKTAHIVVDSPCTITESTFSTTAGGVVIRVGESMGVAGPGYRGGGYVIAVERG